MRCKCRWETDIKMDCIERGCEGLELIVAQDEVQHRFLFVNTAMNLRST
jgi:hypothetical protein